MSEQAKLEKDANDATFEELALSLYLFRAIFYFRKLPKIPVHKDFNSNCFSSDPSTLHR